MLKNQGCKNFYTREGVEIPKDELIELIKDKGGGD